MAISVVDPVAPAFDRTRRMLFRPFDVNKWFILGFTAWVAELFTGGSAGGPGGAGGGPNPRVQVPAGGGGVPPSPLPHTGSPAVPPGVADGARDAFHWVQANLAVVLAIAIPIAVLVIGLTLLLVWLRSRFAFIFLDNVVHDRAEVKEPWFNYRQEGNSLFGFQILFSIGSFVAVLAVIAFGLFLAWPDLRDGEFGISAISALALGLPALILLGLALGAVGLFLQDFVVPIMYQRRQGVMASWNDFRFELFEGRSGKFLLYFLFRGIVVSLVLGALALGVTCATCCVALLPYIGSVILLPLSVFGRLYPLYYLRQFGLQWQIVTEGTGKPSASALEFLD